MILALASQRDLDGQVNTIENENEYSTKKVLTELTTDHKILYQRARYTHL